MGFEPTALFESVALYLLALGVGDNEEKIIEANRCGEDIRLRVKDCAGEVVLSVVGKNYDELGSRLALACLHNVSIEHLGALHLEPLNEAVPVLQRVQ